MSRSLVTLAGRIALLASCSAAPAQVLFGPSQPAAFVSTTAQVRYGLADVDDDGLPDLVASIGGAITWRHGNGAGLFGGPITPVPDTTGTEILLEDLDGDGRKDLIATTGATATVQIALATTSTGSLIIAGNWPTGVPSGLQIAAQFWFPSSAVAGYAASSGVQIVTP